MTTPLISSLLADYQWKLSLYAALGVFAVTIIGKYVLMLVPTIREAANLNGETLREKMKRPGYAANIKGNLKWSLVYMAVLYGLILPFCLTLETTPWWSIPLDMAVILMVYDFVIYMTHRFLFHDSAFLDGPLKWMHAVHHRQHNPCRRDTGYVHPLESAIGLGLYGVTVFALSRFMGNFHVATIIVTTIVLNESNLQNHALWTVDRFPFKYLNRISVKHHHHHARFTGGNFGNISLFYDWMFGTLDNGEGGKTRMKNESTSDHVKPPDGLENS